MARDNQQPRDQDNVSSGARGTRSVAHGEFHLERVYDSPPTLVWQALTQPEAKAKWFAGADDRWQVLERQVDVRVGGRERLKGRWDTGLVTTFDAIYQDVVGASLT